MRRTSSSSWRTTRSISASSAALVVRDALADRGEPQEHGRQALSDLVVQALSDAEPLGLLGLQRPSAAGMPLGLEPIEHLVEGGDELGQLTAARRRQVRAGTQEIDASHALGELLERSKDRPEQQEIGDDDHDESGDDDHRLVELDRIADRDRRPDEQRGDDHEQQRVCAEHSPEQRDAGERPCHEYKYVPRGGRGGFGDSTRPARATASARSVP